MIDSDALPSSDGNPCAERLMEIAATLDRVGIEGVRVRCAPVDGDRFVITLDLLNGSLGERLIAFFAEYARKHKTIFSVKAALKIASAIRAHEARHDN